MRIGQLIKVQRALLGIRQGQLARRVGISQWRLSRIENGFLTPTPELLARIVKAIAGGA